MDRVVIEVIWIKRYGKKSIKQIKIRTSNQKT